MTQSVEAHFSISQIPTATQPMLKIVVIANASFISLKRNLKLHTVESKTFAI